MRLTVALIGAALALGAGAAQPPGAVAIVGGSRVAPGGAPFAVDLQHTCSGSLIAADRVLTAAHYSSRCYGDSGGPLVTSAADGQPLQIATDSWGRKCGFDHGGPEIYSDLRAVRSFVLGPDPVWRPLAIGRPRLSGSARPPRTVHCEAPAYLAPRPTSRRYVFSVRAGL